MSVDNLKTILWEEKYRPQNLKELIVPQRIRTIFEQGVIQSMLLYGTAGIGKTSAAKAICKEFEHNYLYLNMSETTGVDTIRDTIMDFAMNRSIIDYANPIKVVIMDEMDGMSQQAFAALRATMEKCSVNTRFIGTCNYVEKIPDPIQSRFLMIDFNFSPEEMNEVKTGQLKRVHEICRNEGLTIATPQAYKKLVMEANDFRSVVKRLQRFKLEGKTVINEEDIKNMSTEYGELYDLVIGGDNPLENYKFVLKNYSNNPDEAIYALGTPFIEFLEKSRPQLLGKIPQVVIENSKHQLKVKFAQDPSITLMSLVYTLQGIFQN